MLCSAIKGYNWISIRTHQRGKDECNTTTNKYNAMHIPGYIIIEDINSNSFRATPFRRTVYIYISIDTRRRIYYITTVVVVLLNTAIQ